METKKITLATLKSFAKKNAEKLYVKNLSSLDGMVDAYMIWSILRVRANQGAQFTARPNLDLTRRNDWGIGCWFVGGSRDYFTPYKADGFVGYEVYNSCGSFVIAVPEAS